MGDWPTTRVEPKSNPLLLGLQAARVNLVPALIIQTIMFALVAGFYWHPPTKAAMESLAAIKTTYGYFFSMTLAILGGAILPEIFVIGFFQRWKIHAVNFANLRFTIVYWAFDGLFVDALYRTLGNVVGNNANPGTVATKVLIDQFIINPLIFVPISLICYEWKHRNYDFKAMSDVFTWGYVKAKAIPTLVTSWCAWIPLLTAIYALPSPLQIPMFALALTIWVMLFTYITQAGKAHESP